MRRELLLIAEMIEAAQRIHELAGGAHVATLESDRLRRDALFWNFTVLGEAAAQLDDRFKQRFSEVPWMQPSRLRNRIVHGYWAIDLEILVTTATDQIPGYIVQLRSVLATLEAGQDPETES